MILRLALLAAAFGAGALLGASWTDGDRPVRDGEARSPVVKQNDPDPGAPPVVWLSGRLVAVTEERVLLQEGDGPTVRLRRFAEGATSFHRLDGGAWREIAPARASAAGGSRACIEALLDDGDFLALRVFLGASCSPAP